MSDIDFNSLDVMNLPINDFGLTYKQALQFEARRLIKCIQECMNDFYHSYHPKLYKRTYGMYYSLSIENLFTPKIIGNTIVLNINENERGYHDSIYGSQANVLLLMNYGYTTHKPWFKDIAYFGYRSGGHFIERGISEFINSSEYDIKVELNIPDKWYNL